MENDLVLMQRQAARRVQQMQAHVRQVLAEHEQQAVQPTAPPTFAPRLYNRPPPPEPPPEPPLADDEGMLSLLSHLDSEQWLLLGLAFLLLRCGGHIELTLALLYLAL